MRNERVTIWRSGRYWKITLWFDGNYSSDSMQCHKSNLSKQTSPIRLATKSKKVHYVGGNKPPEYILLRLLAFLRINLNTRMCVDLKKSCQTHFTECCWITFYQMVSNKGLKVESKSIKGSPKLLVSRYQHWLVATHIDFMSILSAFSRKLAYKLVGNDTGWKLEKSEKTGNIFKGKLN